MEDFILKKFLAIVATMLALGIVSLACHEIKRIHNENKDNEVASESDPMEEAGSFYTYKELENIILCLAGSDEEKRELERLVDPLQKSEYIDCEYVQAVMQVINAPESAYKGILSSISATDFVTKRQFNLIVDELVEMGAIDGLVKNEIYVFDITADSDGKRYISFGSEAYEVYQDFSEGYRDKVLSVYTKNGILVKVAGLSNEKITLKHAYVINDDDSQISFLYDGLKKKINLSILTTDNTEAVEDDFQLTVDENESYLATEQPAEEAFEKNENFTGLVADIVLDNSGIIEITKSGELLEGNVLNVKEAALELKDKGELALSDDFVIYDVTSAPRLEKSIALLTGYDNISIIKNGEKAVAAIVKGELKTKNIRVIICNDDYSSYDLNTITISCDGEYTITYPGDRTEEKEAGSTTTISYKNYKKNDKIVFTPKTSDSRFSVLNINRNYGNPKYRGSLEVRVLNESLNLINELSLEEYLYSVVASEMPAGTPAEALRAVAICARGYAYSKLTDGAYADYNAHLDDSTLCQVYNNVMETEETIQAVRDTYGMVPSYEGDIIVPFYYSTSSGMSCTNEDVWGGSAYPYLKAHVQDIDKSELDLSDENAFVDFIDNSLGYDVIEKEMPYYRWSVEFTTKEITDVINQTLAQRVSMSSDNISVMQENGKFKEDKELATIGSVKDIRILERSECGAVKLMEIEGTEATIRISGQTNLRNLISPEKKEIIRNDSTAVNGWTSLPSTYYYIEKTQSGYTINGGGFGHGVGLSQNGAALLALDGYDYSYIIQYYFDGTELESVYQMQ